MSIYRQVILVQINKKLIFNIKSNNRLKSYNNNNPLLYN